MRGLESHHIHAPHTLLRDTRPLGERWQEIALAPFPAAIFFSLCGLWVLLMPASHCLPEPVLFIALIYLGFFSSYCRSKKFTYRKPLVDSSFKSTEEGLFFLGNEQINSEEIWLGVKDIQKHFFVAGTTGSGKTKSLLAALSNSLLWGSGFTAVDGKADISLWADVYALAQKFGRQDDLLVLNFLKGDGKSGTPSHTLNPFSFVSAAEICELLISLLPDNSLDGMWQGRAIALLKAVVPSLTWKRDHGGLLLDISVIRHSLPLVAVIRLSRDDSLPDSIREGLTGYLGSLPGYKSEYFNDDGEEKILAQEPRGLSTCREQHGYLSMQFTEALGNLADHYGHIFKASQPDIDMRDVVLNRRILLVLLPTLEKSPQEAANLGKIVVSNLKAMMASGLGSALEGTRSEVVEKNNRLTLFPYLCSFDEVGYYTTPGMGLMAAQARSLGFSLIFSAQDLPSMRKRIKEEADSILANCNTKIFLKLEDAGETRTLFEKTAGEAYVTQVSGFTNTSSVSGTYHDRLEAVVDRRLRADYLDVKAQKEGQAHIFFDDRMVRANLFYTPIDLPEEFRVNHFLALAPVEEKEDTHLLDEEKPLGTETEEKEELQKKHGLLSFASLWSRTPDQNIAETQHQLKDLFSLLDRPLENVSVSISVDILAENMDKFTRDLFNSQPHTGES